METVVIPAKDLRGDLAMRWAEIQKHNPSLFSPFFRPEFTQAVGTVRDNAFVAIVDGGAAFFPFQRNSLGFGRPIGGRVSDYHGLIAASDYKCDVASLMKDCRLRSWYFDHVPSDQSNFVRWRTLNAGSPVVDLDQSAPPGSSRLHSDLRRQWRRLERDFGQVEVELEVNDPLILEKCLEWKSDQYHRTGLPDLFARPWARSLAEVIAAKRGPEFSGILSVLRAGGRPVAVHFGMRSGSVCHYWFPAYDTQFRYYSPGMLLLSEMISQGSKIGIKMIDLGKGDTEQKSKLANRRVPLIEGVVANSPFVFWIAKSKVDVRESLQKHPTVKSILSPAYRLYRRTNLGELAQRFWTAG
ncbi:GNAT family N-acetyltransferase [Microvirga sp. BT689]|uniref:GNAT family N-acetyltransferase n=1 Tax=Microvirga arvi TaxID=2778731 RepID=UPI00194FA220|nr:GNAT family N-acetyltransferase [Microvirga arvi]MBM6584248.1 GNAT family N-acetyltransferase [Microvirga arvi]